MEDIRRTSILKKVIIIGSSRKNGNTEEVVNNLNSLEKTDIIDLNDFNISYYDYDHKNRNDDFINLVKRMIYNYDVFIFATPVYWYSMSGIMKVFFDRLTDLLDNEKELGRELRGKNMAVLTSSIGDNLGDKFWFPFKETAKYLGMNYIGNIHTIAGKEQLTLLKTFITTIENNAKP